MSSSAQWTDAARAALAEIVAAHPTAGYVFYRALLADQGHLISSPEAIRSHLRFVGVPGSPSTPRPRIYRRQTARDPSPILTAENSTSQDRTQAKRRDYYLALEAHCASWAQENEPERVVTLDFSAATKPIALVFSSDWHYGLKSVDYARLRADNRAVAEAPGAYMIAAGDLTDNTKPQLKSRGNLYVTAASPAEQWEGCEDVTQELRDDERIVSVVAGNHDYWDMDEAGINTVSAWCDKLGLSYHGHGGVYRVLVGDMEYWGIVRHEYPGGGGINKTTAPIAMYNRFQRVSAAAHLDFTYTGHLHYNLQYAHDHAAGECHHLRGGSYQRFSDYANQKVGAPYTEAGTPVLILDPARHNIVSWKGNRLAEGLAWLALRRAT